MKFKRILSMLLASVMLAGLLPLDILADSIADALPAGTHGLSDGAIQVVVSDDNGGFIVRTEAGDSLIKSDDNRDLLYHREEYDTSFTSFRVTKRDGTTKDYIFGGDYGFLGLASSAVTTTQDETGITSVWSVDGITFTQRIELAGDGSNEHGAVLISYKAAKTSGEPVTVQARMLLDTALGESDSACYQVVDQFGRYRALEQETLLTEADHIPANFFGYDDPGNPSTTAYHISVGETKPYQVAFAHWNSLGATLFDFAPDTTLTYTNVYNGKYLTADSAVGLYYDMGTVSADSEGTCATYYGVYSNKTVAESESVAINVTAPTELTLSADKKSYLPAADGLSEGIFEIQTQLQNFESPTAKKYDRITVAVYTTNGITALDADGNPYATTYLEPYSVDYVNVTVGQTFTRTFRLKADVGAVSEFRKIEIRAFDTSEGTTLTTDKIIGTKSFYVLCPGGDGKLPEVIFTSMSPNIIYSEGQRNLFVAGKNFSLLVDQSQYTVKAYSVSDPAVAYDIPSSQVTFSQEEGADTMTIMLTEKMATGTYEIKLEWIGDPPAGLSKEITAPCLTFTVSDDEQYKNSYYGILAVVQEGKGGNSQYYVKSYKTEKAFDEDIAKGKYEEVLLTFRGEFEEVEKEGGAYEFKATSLKRNGKADNVVVVNECIDFENGVVTVKPNQLKDGTFTAQNGVIVEFDGDLYTSVKRSKIWSGEATFPEIENGIEYDLVPYNSDGERMEGSVGEELTLLWPCGLGIAQAISGMAFNMTFGAMGILYDTNESKLSPDNTKKVIGRVVSFSASLDLSFLVPNAGQSKNDKRWEYISTHFSSDMTSNFMRDKWRGNDMLKHTYRGINFLDTRNKDGQASVMVQDIMYGCGKGLMGINFDVELAIPGYFDAMPAIMGHLAVNTIGGYEITAEGLCQFGTLEIEASVKVKDYNGKPIPDKLYFAIMGFEPGINVDGFGVLWLTGGGGGIDKLYDTIFGGSSVPPLKILLTVSFDILKVLSARVDLSLSLRGISLTARDVRVKYFDMKVLNRLQLTFEWYPDFYFMASVDANILQIIRGQGYIVIMSNDEYDAFVEFFIRASVQIPEVIPIIGGIDIGGADLGANNDKIWGVVRALGAELGITYYWGGDVDFGTGSAVSKPSFPSLLGYEDVPVYYDEERQQTLYMRVGSNVSIGAEPYIAGEDEGTPRLFASDRTIASAADRLSHTIGLGAFNETVAAFVVNYPAQTEEVAESLARQIVISGKTLTFYDAALKNETTANANVVYNEEKKTASVSITFSEAGEFNQNYTVTTPVASDIVLYDITPMPSMTLAGASLTSGNMLNVQWSGYDMGSLDSVFFFVTTDPNGGVDADAYPVYYTTTDIDAGQATFALPEDLPSGTYYLKAVYSKEDYVNEQVMCSDAIAFTNPNQPAVPVAVTASNGGSYMLDFTVDMNASDNFDGYLVNVYREVGGTLELTDINGIEFVKESDGTLPKLEVGGYFDMPEFNDAGENLGTTKKVGIAPGETYKVGVTAYNNITDASGAVTGQVRSVEVLSSNVVLRTPTPPTVEVKNETPYKTINRIQAGVDAPIPYDTFAYSDVTFSVTSDVAVSGTWTLNDSVEGTFKTGDQIPFTNLSDGDYFLTIRGEDAEGDTFVIDKVFSVDTMPPVLLLSSPVNGAFFEEDGTILVEGVTDENAKLTIYLNDVPYGEEKTVEEMGGTMTSDGTFTLTLQGDKTRSVQSVRIRAEDDMGNVAQTKTAFLYNEGFGRAESVTIYVDGKAYTGGNISVTNGVTAKLSLGVNTPNGTFLLPDDAPVDWVVKTAYGNADVDEKGVLTVGAGSMGTIIARFHVANIDETAAKEGYVGAMQASLTFGAETNSLTEDKKEVVVVTGMNGTVTGAGFYTPGSTVTLTAKANAGYKFERWIVLAGNVTLTDTGAETITFRMPMLNVRIEAVFAEKTDNGGGGAKPIPTPSIPDRFERPDPDKGDKPTPGEGKVDYAGEIRGKAGELYYFNLPANTDGTIYAPYYFDEGKMEYVRMSGEAVDDKLYFVAPRDAVYYLGENYMTFRDIDGHWAEQSILYSAARGLFNGVEEGIFAPETAMTRGMFVTVLGRLSGVEADPMAESIFTDVKKGMWYTPYVVWAAENGIVTGYGDGRFGPDDLVTREQICTILDRYLKKFGYTLEASADPVRFADADEISAWAKNSVTYCQTRGLIVGMGNNRFAPLEDSTRAEVATILQRLVMKILQAKIAEQ